MRFKEGDKLVVFTPDQSGVYVGNGDYVERVRVVAVLSGDRLRVEDPDGVRYVIGTEQVKGAS